MYLHGSLPMLYLKTATPIILIMMVNGLFALVDAWFLGEFVSAEALTAVTMMFSPYMVLVAFSTLVSNGFSSVVARKLGAREFGQAQNAFMGAQMLALIMCLVLIGLFLLFHEAMIGKLTNYSAPLSADGYTYISLLIFGSPMMFLISINVDGLRAEGRLPFMTLVTVTSALLNIPFNYLLIVEMDMGVAGSAYGTLLSMVFTLGLVVTYRLRGKAVIPFGISGHGRIWRHWGEMLALGLPFSLTYIGVSLIAFSVLHNIAVWAEPNMYDATAGAYGIATRLMTFMYLPLLGLSFAFQSILGNNYGAQLYQRSSQSFRMAIFIALVYCVIMQALFQLAPGWLGGIFVDDQAIIDEIARTLPIMSILMVLFGPQLMATTYFQAVGDAPRALILSVTRTYLLALPLIFGMPYLMGEPGIWYANPVTEALMALLTLLVFWKYRRKRDDIILQAAD